MNVEEFMTLLLICSILTSLITEGIKVLLNEHSITYYANTLVAVVSIIVAVLSMVAIAIINSIPLGMEIFVYGILLCVGSWLCAMLGYDKVVQAIEQVRG